MLLHVLVLWTLTRVEYLIILSIRSVGATEFYRVILSFYSYEAPTQTWKPEPGIDMLMLVII